MTSSCFFNSTEAQRFLYVNTYFNGTAFVSCNPSCKTCVGPSPSDCTECVGGILQVSSLNEAGICRSGCEFGSYYSIKLHQCFKCHESCINCSGPTNDLCYECSVGYSEFEGRCLKNCTNNICLFCIGCRTCNQTVCLSCFPPFSILDGRCIIDFDSIQVYSKNNVCYKCHHSCSSCFGPSKLECIQCKESQNYIWDSIEKSCNQIQCTGAFYLQDQTCARCHSRCMECHGPTEYNCTSCMKPLILLNGRCVTCTDGYIYASGNCIEICGDGIDLGAYECDDGNSINGDGCSSSCKIELNWECINIFNKSHCTSLNKPYAMWVKIFSSLEFNILFSDNITNLPEIVSSLVVNYTQGIRSWRVESIDIIDISNQKLIRALFKADWDIYSGDSISFIILNATNKWGKKRNLQSISATIPFNRSAERKETRLINSALHYICLVNGALSLAMVITSIAV